MNQSPSEEEIEKLLEEIRSGSASRRKQAIESLAKLGISNEQIINGLRTAAIHDYNEFVREAAKVALAALGQDLSSVIETHPAGVPAPIPIRPLYTYKTRGEKILHFVIGFVGWWVFNGALWFALTGGKGLGYGVFILNLLVFPANLLILIVLAFVRHWISLGWLAAIAVNLLIALIVGVASNGFCFIPFFTPIE